MDWYFVENRSFKNWELPRNDTLSNDRSDSNPETNFLV